MWDFCQYNTFLYILNMHEWRHIRLFYNQLLVLKRAQMTLFGMSMMNVRSSRCILYAGQTLHRSVT